MKTLQIRNISGKPANPSCQKIYIYRPERINLAEEENNSLLTNCKEVEKELNNFFVNAIGPVGKK